MTIPTKELKDACGKLGIVGVNYCVLRIPKESSDDFEVDILISESETMRVKNILISNGFTHSEIREHMHYRKDSLHLDIVSSLRYGGHKYTLEQGILQRAICINDMFIISHEDEFIMLLLRCLFDKKDFSKKGETILNLVEEIGEKRCFEILKWGYYVTTTN